MRRVVPRQIGREASKNQRRREAEGFYTKYLSGDSVLDIGYRDANPNSVPVTENAIGVGLDYPGYDGRTLPFEANSQDSVFASHSLEHIEDYKSVLADWYRVLKISGYLIIAVPHRDLYERKPTLSSLFNPDHRRFYTPASLLAEVEESLPVAGYRIRSLKDVDEGFNYAILPGQPPVGCYEIELVIQKIAPPVYADRLRPNLMTIEWNGFCADLVGKGIQALKDGRAADVQDIVSFLTKQQLPQFAELARLVRGATVRSSIDELRSFLVPILMAQPIDEDFYRKTYGIEQAHAHYVRHGYFEGRLPGPLHGG
ncbi:MAG: methyltransferase domain-containing protein [Steroidobacteraceae bacterium]